jgi:hypothetical protein
LENKSQRYVLKYIDFSVFTVSSQAFKQLMLSRNQLMVFDVVDELLRAVAAKLLKSDPV